MTNSSASKTNNTTINIQHWSNKQLAELGFGRSSSCHALSGDASFRKYFRLTVDESHYIAVFAPPETEKNAEFLSIAQLLADQGINVPQVLAVDLEQGYFLQSDLGDTLLLGELNDTSVEHWYSKALTILGQLQQLKPADALLTYSAVQMREDLERFPEWFVEGLLGYEMSAKERELFDIFCQQLIDQALQQPQVPTHYDYQSRNLMVTADSDLAVIDFQDTLIAPMTYDLVSLLRDCYIKWPLARTHQWALSFAEQAKTSLYLDTSVSDETFLGWFDFMSLQRHVRVLGTFGRLYLRDNKPGYLSDIPLVCEYVQEVAGAHSEFSQFTSWFVGTLLPIAQQQTWYSTRTRTEL
ncbi:MAG: aminoglycoside phosphotransferase family protein [Pseudomonadales bacterium]